MELVEGPTLADRIAQGPIPIDEALPIARQIAEALEAAHEQGIIHRDLKPANIKVREDGTVKVLDFGLAKLTEPGAVRDGPSDLSQSPTLTSPAAMTGMGVILGTAAYMSPEQARGRAVDKRTDVWAFGAVLYEMLTGRRAFDGDDITEVIAAVVKTTPNWTALPADVPPPVVTLIQRCLEKDRKARIGDIAVARFLLSDHATLSAIARPPPRTSPSAARTLASDDAVGARGTAGRRADRVASSATAGWRAARDAPADERAAGGPARRLDRVCTAGSHRHRAVARRPARGVRRHARHGHAIVCSRTGSRRGDAGPGDRRRQRAVLFARRRVDRILGRQQDQEGAGRGRAARHDRRRAGRRAAGRELGRRRHHLFCEHCGHLQGVVGRGNAGHGHHTRCRPRASVICCRTRCPAGRRSCSRP